MPGRVLLVTWDGGGNIPPEFAVCHALSEAGHHVHILTNDSLKVRTERTGSVFRPIRHAGQLDSKNSKETTQDRIDNALLSDALMSDIDEALETLAPDLVIADSMMLLALAKLAQSPLPSVAFHHSLGNLVFGGLVDQLSMSMKGDMDRLLAAHGLASYERPIHVIGDNDLILTATYRDFDQPNENFPQNLCHVGPLRDRPQQRRTEIERRFPERPLVVVSLSTSHMDQLSLLQRISDALGGVSAEALITTGPAVNPSELALRENTRAMEFVAHDDLLPDTDLLITHAGHGTVVAGLTFGTPMLCFPMGRDQPAVAERATALGLAHTCRPDASTESIVAAVAKALADSEMAATSRAFAQRVGSHPGIEEAVKRIEELMK